ncbi:hypothetical protein IFM89_014374 [Coptis chinensis]|uniref:BED-type domain-containing protein n=1 Tax=Coptis chinensis TaxID=261450 RepID=A0A835LAX8_9MAGN|nr:hypothetical protein IFM89_014374 [Coptis chinensis]
MSTPSSSVSSVAKSNTIVIDDGKDESTQICKVAPARKLRSIVWEEFDKKKDEKGVDKAICIHCKENFDGKSTNGTSHLRSHLKRCSRRVKPGSG